MVGRLGKNLRSGHIAEDIGVLFLRSFCAVATIRQEDDFGTDTIATLLKEDNGLLYAENSFYVQIKSKSVDKIAFDERETNWLLHQDLPFFILLIDKISQEIYLYTTNPIYEIITKGNVKRLEINFESLVENEYNRVEIKGNKATCKLGPPIIQISEADSRLNENSQRIYSLMKIWVEKEREQFEIRKLGRTQTYEWKTWVEPEIFGTHSHGSYQNLKRDLEKIKPYLEYLGNHVMLNPDFNDPSAVNAFRYFIQWFKNENIETELSEVNFSSKST